MSIDKRVGVVGLYNSGKTVFLTSLINHLSEHDPSLCSLKGGKGRVEGFREQPIAGGFSHFDYEKYRQFLVEQHRWPNKTTAVSEFKCSFKLTQKGTSVGVDLAFLDVPGERLADLGMARQSYDKWSDSVLHLLEIRPEYRVHADEYLKLLAEAQPSTKRVTNAYKRLLARLILDYKPLVTPSTFLVAPDGSYPNPTDHTLQALAAKRHSGLDGKREFAPMSHACRDKHRKMANAFRKAYEEYKGKIVQPIVEWLSNANVLLVFIDVTTLLAGGLGMYEGNREILKDLVKATDPGASWYGNLGRWALRTITFGYADYRAVERVAFVASKADKVLKDDRQRMHGLLRNMTRRPVDGIDGLKRNWFVCSAVDSIEDVGNGKLEGYLVSDGGVAEGATSALFTPSRVPDNWPDGWEPGAFIFPEVWPVMPARRDAPPKHFQLHRILDFILEE